MHDVPQEDYNWKELAACGDTDPNMFYSFDVSDIEKAKQVCAQCVVRMECLDYAIAHNDENGVWGGTSEDERRKIIKSRRRGLRRDVY